MFLPILSKPNPKAWGQITEETDRKEFVDQLQKFDSDLKRKISNLRGDVELRVPEAPHDKIEQKPAAYSRAARDPQVLAHFQTIIASWCEQITKYMEHGATSFYLE